MMVNMFCRIIAVCVLSAPGSHFTSSRTGFFVPAENGPTRLGTAWVRTRNWSTILVPALQNIKMIFKGVYSYIALYIESTNCTHFKVGVGCSASGPLTGTRTMRTGVQTAIT